MTSRDGLSAARRMTGLAGLATAILFGAGSALWALDQPKAGASAPEILAFYEDNAMNIIIGGSLSLVSIGLFVFFVSGVRSILRAHDGEDLFPTAAFGGGLMLLAAGLGAETINLAAALRADAGDLSADLARTLFEVSYVLGYNGAGVGIGVFLGATAAVALRTGALMPAPVASVSLVLALAFCTPLSVFLLAPAVLAVAISSVMLLRPSPGDRAASG